MCHNQVYQHLICPIPKKVVFGSLPFGGKFRNGCKKVLGLWLILFVTEGQTFHWLYATFCRLKTVVFIAGKKNPATEKKIIRFSIENLIANISFYALSWPKLNFGCYLTFEIIF